MIPVGLLGAVTTLPAIPDQPAMALLTCGFLAIPALTWRYVRRDGTTITIRRAFGSRELDADRVAIGYRVAGRGELAAYVTDGVDTVTLSDRSAGMRSAGMVSDRAIRRDVARLTALLLDPEADGAEADGAVAEGGAAEGGAGNGGAGGRRDAGGAGQMRRRAAIRKVEADRAQIAASREYARSRNDGQDRWVGRRFWLLVVLVAGAVSVYVTLMLLAGADR